jgi:RNA polymerase primary sigma factor
MPGDKPMMSLTAVVQQSEEALGEREALEQYLREINRIPSLSAAKEAELARLIRAGDKEALNRLVEANLRFVVTIALEYQNKGLPLLDLINEGNIGLIMAAQRFDATRGCKFISYAVWWVRQAIRQAFAEQVRFIRLPRLQVEALQKLEKAIRQKEQSTASSVNMHTLAMHEAGRSPARRRRLVWLVNAAAPPFSLDEPHEEDESGWAAQVEDTLHPRPDEALMDGMLKEAVHEAVQHLPEREANVICQYYGMFDDTPKSLEEIGHELGLSRERVRQLKERGLQRLRHASRGASLRAFL